ncbi:hypothetical protein I5M27_05820 [Adhaeribacter sp. BT258]|uniref:Uncharacterized protein n=1 Tax=Adhaeribacter terrigena TaxID=2793070 RepID=A0ABS1BZI3_9BACT|nr:hypothetical protein [Adhaeribacter terrigena]MBK0402494.1 hypothetical protein [Adhaeribacter terrigena]
MKDLNATIIRTACGKPFDLKKAAPLASNAKTPYGPHNYVVYKTINGFYLKGYNTGCNEKLLNAFELISRNEAMQHLQIPAAHNQISVVYC